MPCPPPAPSAAHLATQPSRRRPHLHNTLPISHAPAQVGMAAVSAARSYCAPSGSQSVRATHRRARAAANQRAQHNGAPVRQPISARATHRRARAVSERSGETAISVEAALSRGQSDSRRPMLLLHNSRFWPTWHSL